jgi:hypothetical protein
VPCHSTALFFCVVNRSSTHTCTRARVDVVVRTTRAKGRLRVTRKRAWRGYECTWCEVEGRVCRAGEGRTLHTQRQHTTHTHTHTNTSSGRAHPPRSSTVNANAIKARDEDERTKKARDEWVGLLACNARLMWLVVVQTLGEKKKKKKTNPVSQRIPSMSSQVKSSQSKTMF